MKPFMTVIATAAPLDMINIDTDQIIPARFLKQPRENGYGQFLFHDIRCAPDGAERSDFPLNQERYSRAAILIANANFGCGSSREGAVYALLDYGFRAVIAPSFNDIFYNNSLRNGFLPIVLPSVRVSALRSLAAARPEALITIDLSAQTLVAAGEAPDWFPIDPLRKACLLAGRDDIELTRQYQDRIDAFVANYRTRLPWTSVSH